MGAVVGSLMGSVTMGITSSALNCICFACPWGGSSVAKYLHISLLLLALITAIIWHFYTDGPFAFPSFKEVVEGGAVENARYFGPWAIGVGIWVYHGLQALLLIGVRDTADRRAIIQNGGWPIKVFALVGCIASCFLLPPQTYSYLFYGAVIGSVLFMSLQSVYLVDCAYRGAELLVEKYEESEGEIWKYTLFGITGLMYTVALLLTFATMFHLSEHLLVGVLNIIIMVVISVCSVLEEVQEANPQAGIFQAGFISFYNTFLFAASTIHEGTMRGKVSGWGGTINTVACVLFVAGLIYYAATVGINRENDMSIADGNLEKGIDVEGEDDPVSEYTMSLFHIYLILASAYATVSIISWRRLEPLVPPVDRKLFKIGDISQSLCKWSPILASWLLSALYLWSLFAPLVFPDHDFS